MKYVHWTMPFGNVDGTIDYKLDIYREAESAPKEIEYLVGAPNPFKPQEKNGGPFETPVRGYTGNIEVVNKTGDLELIDRLIPRDNTKRFVRLMRLDKAGRRRWVMWQGFLASDSYTQQYVDREEYISIPVNSVLAAMENVEAEQYSAAHPEGLRAEASIRQIIEYCIGTMTRKSGQAKIVDAYYIPAYSASAMLARVKTYPMFGTEDMVNTDESVETSVVGNSLSEVLGNVCKMMGWTVRENGAEWVFEDPYDETHKMQKYEYSDGAYVLSGDLVDMVGKNMRDFVYHGTGHSKSITRGRKVVKVTARLNKMFDEVTLPDFPYTNVDKLTTGNMQVDESKNIGILEAVVCGKSDVYNRAMCSEFYKSCNYFDAAYRLVRVEDLGLSSVDELIEHFPMEMPTWDATISYYAGAMWARMDVTMMEEKVVHISKEKKLEEGLLLSFLPDMTPDDKRPIFEMDSMKIYDIKSGYMHLDMDMGMVGGLQLISGVPRRMVQTKMEEKKSTQKAYDLRMSFYMEVQMGNRWFNGQAWTSNRTKMVCTIDGNSLKCNMPDEVENISSGILMPMPYGGLTGNIVVRIYPWSVTNPSIENKPCMLFVKDIKIKHVNKYDHMLSDRTENVYTRRLDFNNTEEESVDVEFASFNDNSMSPSLLLNSTGEPMEKMVFGSLAGDRMVIRPELRLLFSMVKYYSAPRRAITLEVKYDPDDEMPKMYITGYDGKNYLPLKDEVNYHTGVRTIECYEIGGYDPDDEEEHYDENASTGGGGGGTLPDPDSPDHGGQEGDDDNDHDQGDPTDPSEPDWGDQDDDGRDDGPDGPDYDGPDYDY